MPVLTRTAIASDLAARIAVKPRSTASAGIGAASLAESIAHRRPNGSVPPPEHRPLLTFLKFRGGTVKNNNTGRGVDGAHVYCGWQRCFPKSNYCIEGRAPQQ